MRRYVPRRERQRGCSYAGRHQVAGLARWDRSAASLTAAGPGGRVRPHSRRPRMSWQPPAAASPAEYRLAITHYGAGPERDPWAAGVQSEEAGAVRVVLAQQLGGSAA